MTNWLNMKVHNSVGESSHQEYPAWSPDLVDGNAYLKNNGVHVVREALKLWLNSSTLDKRPDVHLVHPSIRHQPFTMIPRRQFCLLKQLSELESDDEFRAIAGLALNRQALDDTTRTVMYGDPPPRPQEQQTAVMDTVMSTTDSLAPIDELSEPVKSTSKRKRKS